MTPRDELAKYLHVFCPSIPRGGASNGGEFRRPCNVYVVLSYTPPYRINGKNVLASHCIERNTDSRYNGPNSQHGRALAKAHAMASNTDAFFEAAEIRRGSLRHKKIIAEIVKHRMTHGA